MTKDCIVEINLERLHYLLRLYNLSVGEFLAMLNSGHKRALNREEVFTNEMSMALLKRIDKIFNKGIYYYIDFTPVSQGSHASIFFRKQSFNGQLNLEARKMVDKFETLKNTLDTYNVLADVSFERQLPSFTVKDNPRETARVISGLLKMRSHKDEKDHLKFIINQLAKLNIYVFEFVETFNKKQKSNVEGFFIAPNVIVVKRQQGRLKRELFTLAHELGHCVINVEEVENVSDELSSGLSEIEKWCNDFAFYLLMGDEAVKLDGLKYVNAKNDYAHDMIKGMSDATHVSMLAIYTRLVIEKKMSQDDYALVRGGIMANVRRAEEKRKQEAKDGKSVMSSPRPIISNLFRDTMQCALYRGVIDEATFCQQLNVKPERMEAYL
ncbi:ImmA/IrrE family metallo-endopeptidase [Prevotella sp. E15-22]|jgi:Zn-dependent peptidase ImmA (M78 family)|uniref:ImmA/IrrE family metallo-endopeptidase n=1 Tax=Prevotella sp. E15-22 TaxID=2937774 RepID=UPI00206CFBF2|nr:ImmA/IrrE family metallo-endopeptidase [Prevotella sp. E15-22]UPS45374.1 ImmA/IrrE family metallo-endopeptidase [Prevotella sp. E15-22]